MVQVADLTRGERFLHGEESGKIGYEPTILWWFESRIAKRNSSQGECQDASEERCEDVQ